MKPGIVIGGTNSGCGKTTVSLGLMALLKRKGYAVAPFKVGPDYIDPGHHGRVCGRPGRNLDGWMLSKDYNVRCFEKGLSGCDLAVVEGVMGFYDGFDGKSEDGSTAQMSKWLDLPVILVVNARSMARSGAALVKGFEGFDRNVRFAGVIFNNVGSPRHLEYLKEALEGHVAMPCIGGIVRTDGVTMPERHLGLVTDDENGWTDERIEVLADLMERSLDMDLILETIFKEGRPQTRQDRPENEREYLVRIGVARDKAFCFYYQDNLDILSEEGAELVFFSPMDDAELPPDLDGIYLGGGYPEMFAERLSGNEGMRRGIAAASASGMPVYSECGGFMYLCSGIRDFNGKTWPMAGCFLFTAEMLPKLRSLGYREVTLEKDTVIGKKGTVARGHEFHYSKIEENLGVETAYAVSPRKGVQTVEGYTAGRTIGSYIHLHFGSRPGTGGDFVAACLAYKKERTCHEA
jgi:cobyrinic acid a,c-diamide synthase